VAGSYATQLALPVATAASILYPVPPSWTFADAAGIAATLPVAYGALALRGRARAGESVLVLGAAGGLGVMAVQVAAAIGCRVIAVASSPAKCEVVRRLGRRGLGEGTVMCIDSSTREGKEWWKVVMEETEGHGVDVVFDPVGLVDLSLKCLAHRGRLLIVGFAGRDAATMEGIKMNRVLLKQAVLVGYVSSISILPPQAWRTLPGPRVPPSCRRVVHVPRRISIDKHAEVWRKPPSISRGKAADLGWTVAAH
jgi:NADPH:quinone reductase-like Zn-dependent oxidoreductase